MATPESSPITTRPPQVEFTNRFVQPPSSLYIDRDDLLFIQTLSALSAIRIDIRARMLTPKGRMVTLAYEHDTTSSPVGTAFARFNLQEGFLLGVIAAARFDTILRGELFLSLSIIRGGAGIAAATHQLSNGYLEVSKAVSWPPGALESSVSGRGIMRAITGNDPAAGAEIAQGVEENSLWRLSSLRFGFTTSAVAANRRVRFVLSRGGNVVAVIPSQHVQTASTAIAYTIAPFGFDSPLRDGEVLIALPNDIFLGEDDTIATSTISLQAGDDYGAPIISVEQWLQGR